MSLTIDTHQHILPDFFWQATENDHAPIGGLAPLRWSKEAAISFMDDAGIDVAIVSEKTGADQIQKSDPGPLDRLVASHDSSPLRSGIYAFAAPLGRSDRRRLVVQGPGNPVIPVITASGIRAFRSDGLRDVERASRLEPRLQLGKTAYKLETNNIAFPAPRSAIENSPVYALCSAQFANRAQAEHAL